MAHDVFISYSRADSDKVGKVRAALEHAGITYWLDTRDATLRNWLGAPIRMLAALWWQQSIIEAVKASRLFILVLTDQSNASGMVMRELAAMARCDKPLLALCFDGVQPNETVSFYINPAQWLQVESANLEAHLPEIIGIVQTLLQALPPQEGPKPRLPGGGETTETDKHRNTALIHDAGQSLGRACFLGVCAILAALALFLQLIGPAVSSQFVGSQVPVLIHNQTWLLFDPLGFDPYRKTEPSRQELNRQLEAITRAGFTGIITTGSNGILGDIPRVAKALGLNVIAGVWNPADQQEVKRAVANRPFVDAYCVGHDGVDYAYMWSDLVSAMGRVRFTTRRPVATTEMLSHYGEDKRLFQISDWLFPDAHVAVRQSIGGGFSADAARDAAATIEMAQKISALPERRNKPVLLKMVSYPWAGAANTSRQEQARFYELLEEATRPNQPGAPRDISISYNGAFDVLWKVGRSPFFPWDAYTGLLDADGAARPAVAKIIGRGR